MERLLAVPRWFASGVLVAAVLTAACATSSPSHPCHTGEEPALMDSLYFGSTMADGGSVSAEDWQRFLAEEITPRFPDGLTSWTAAGQWRNGAGVLEQESSFVLHIVHADTAQAGDAILDVMRIYKERFRQEAVLRVRSAACISY